MDKLNNMDLKEGVNVLSVGSMECGAIVVSKEFDGFFPAYQKLGKNGQVLEIKILVEVE